ncbi:MAG: glutamate-cysteine ligase family protein [Planctomycetes bacterium]|jgi:glutathione synthase/RimK-type ligase-like ATP-grasp enzyme/gamma-glutamyl:cysteine ligase YbdK (ATP-grasp superfamily)|nr:glutamate-cysteine ligase family protein [Planctomycetota bacterium]
MKRHDTLIVVSRQGDLPLHDGNVVTADEFLEGREELLRKDLTVVNLCRSWRYLSKGYYVSLLADARGQRVIPTVDTIETLGRERTVFRRLQEADIETVEDADRRSRRHGVPESMSTREENGGSDKADVPLVRCSGAGGVAYRPANSSELAEAWAYMGSCPDPRFRKLASATYRLFPVPILRIRLLREEEIWKVLDASPVLLGKLPDLNREELVRVLREGGAPKKDDEDDEDVPQVSIAILFDEKDPHKPSSGETIDRLERVASDLNVHAYRIGPDEMHRLGEYDALFIRTLTGLELPAFRFALSAEALGMPVIDDSRSIIRCSNKVFLRELLQREGIPTPLTVTASPETRYDQLRDALGVPFILKVPDGSFSSAVFKVNSVEEYAERSAELFKVTPLVVAQAWTPTDFDWRIAVLDGKPLFTCKYHMARGHWQILARTRVGTRSGRVEAIPRDLAPRDVVRTACRAASLIGNGLYGVDLKETPKGPVVIEVNDNPNIDLGYEDGAEGDEVYREVVNYFLKRVRRHGWAPPQKAPVPAPVSGDREAAAFRAPIGKPMGETGPWRAFEVLGLELEYVVVDRDLNVLPYVEEILATFRGRPASDVTLGLVGLSNEIMDHVFEIKTLEPLRKLAETEQVLAEAVRRVDVLLADRFRGRLMPTGMHPWFRPQKARLWRRSNQAIYRTYERLFSVQTHGWANVQASHVNLPLGRDDEAVAMMNAAALLTPYLPAVAASSPIVEGDPGPAVDNRLWYLLDHQHRVPESTGDFVPEFIEDLADYKRKVFQPMFRAVDRLPDASAIRHEFLNARAAVFKFTRESMEVRVLDMQECVRMDVAIAAFTRGALKGLSRALLSRKLELPNHGPLVADFRESILRGTRARVFAPHLPIPREPDGKGEVRDALRALLAIARKATRPEDHLYLDLVAKVIEAGNLSERISAALLPFMESDDDYTEAARRLYIRLSDCLLANEPWDGTL